MLKIPRPRTITLASGATLLHQRNPVSPTIAFGVWFNRGSRDEGEGERGLSHLLEHMVFRGTERRDALRIAYDLEAIGGQWDAFTGKESTCFHCKVLEEHFAELIDIFADIVLTPAFPGDAFKLERRVVQEEIRSVKDSPEESVHELFYTTLFREHPLAHPVAGYLKDISRFTLEDLTRFHGKIYTASNTVLGFVGNLASRDVVSIIERRFRFKRKRGAVARSGHSIRSGRIRSLRRSEWSQSHVCIGACTVAASDSERHAIVVLSNILGGGVSSRLFQSMRERTGLAYSIYTHTNFWTDTGCLWSYFSVEPKNLPAALEIFHDELEKIRRDGVTQAEIESAHAQIKAAIIFGIEHVDTRLFRLFQGECYHGRYISPDEVIRAIERIDRGKIIEAARAFLAPGRLTYTTCGPVTLRGLVPAGGRPYRCDAGRGEEAR